MKKYELENEERDAAGSKFLEYFGVELFTPAFEMLIWLQRRICPHAKTELSRLPAGSECLPSLSSSGFGVARDGAGCCEVWRGTDTAGCGEAWRVIVPSPYRTYAGALRCQHRVYLHTKKELSFRKNNDYVRQGKISNVNTAYGCCNLTNGGSVGLCLSAPQWSFQMCPVLQRCAAISSQ